MNFFGVTDGNALLSLRLSRNADMYTSTRNLPVWKLTNLFNLWKCEERHSNNNEIGSSLRKDQRMLKHAKMDWIANEFILACFERQWSLRHRSLKRNIYNNAAGRSQIFLPPCLNFITKQVKLKIAQCSSLSLPPTPKKGLKLGLSSKLCLSERCRSRCEKRKFFLLISNWLTQRRNKLFKRSSADCSTRGVTLRNAARNTTDCNMRGCVKIAPWYFARQIIHGKWQNNRGRKHFLDFWSWRLLCTPRGQPVSVSWKHY